MSFQSIKAFSLCFLTISIFLVNIACEKVVSKEDLNKYVYNDKILISNIFKNIPSESNRYLVFPKDLCRKCFRQIIDHFEQKEERGQVILVGANSYDVKRLNTIHRNSLKFWKGEFEHYEALLSEYPNVMRGYVRYVETGPDTLIYRGKGKDRTERTADVLDYFVERDSMDVNE